MKVVFAVVSLILFPLSLASTSFNVIDLGADSYGTQDSSNAFFDAWEKACQSSDEATILVPDGGTFLLKAVEFNGPCKNNVIFQINGDIVIGDVSASHGYWITFRQIDRLTVSGKGTVNGNGAKVWKCSDNCQRATSLLFSYTENLLITGITSTNPQMFHISIFSSKAVTVDNVVITAQADSPNTDGIHLSNCNDVRILNSKIETGDDCVSIGPGVSNTFITSTSCGPGHGFSIGSLGRNSGEGLVRNITVQDVVLTDTSYGVRIKTFANDYDGSVSDVLFQHITVNQVQLPIAIDQHYKDGDSFAASEGSSQVEIRNVNYKNITGTSTSQVAVKLSCSSAKPCTNIIMDTINLHYNGKAADSSCENANGDMAGDNNIPDCL